MWPKFDSGFVHQFHPQFAIAYRDNYEEYVVSGSDLDMVVLDGGFGMFMGQANLLTQVAALHSSHLKPNILQCSLIIDGDSLSAIITSVRPAAYASRMMGLYTHLDPLSAQEMVDLATDLDMLMLELDEDPTD